jgi:hypothetical protein
MEVVFDTNGNEKQKEVCRAWTDSQITEIVYGGSKGSGKSFLGSSLIFCDAFMYPGTHYFIARKQLNDLRKFTIPTIYEAIEALGLSKGYVTFNGQDNFFKCYNGSKVFLLEASFLPTDPLYMRFGSMQMTRGWIEEAGEFEEAAKNNLMASVGRWKNDEYKLPPKLLQTCNPSKNYLYREFYKKSKEKALESWKRFIQAFPEDNKMLPDGYLENLRRSLNKNEKERLLFGNWEYDDDPAALMNYESITDIFTNRQVPKGDMYITADIARFGSDKTVIMVWSGQRAEKIVTVAKGSVTDTAERIEKLEAEYGVRRSHIIVDEDGVGGGVKDILKCVGFVNNSSPVPVKDDKRQKENFANLKSQCYFRLAEAINKGEIYVHCDDSKVKQLIIEELEQVKQKDMDKDVKKSVVPKEKVKELLGRSPDYSDTLMMRQYFELKPKRRVLAA